MKFYSNINLNKNELQNAVVHIVNSPSEVINPVEGQIIYDSSSNLLKFYDGSAWAAFNTSYFSVFGDSGSSTIEVGEVKDSLRFFGGKNITTEVSSSDHVTFNLDDSINVETSVLTPFIVSTDINSYNLNTFSLSGNLSNVFTLNSTDVNTNFLNATSGYVAEDFSIMGNLTVRGNTTTIDSTLVTLVDPIITLNKGASGLLNNISDIGFLGERGSAEDNVAFFWDEDTDGFVSAYTSASGSDIEILPLTGYTRFTAGNIVVSSDLFVLGSISEYQGSSPSVGEVLIGDGFSFKKGTITASSETGINVSTATPNNINFSIDIDSATDGTSITEVSDTDKLLISDDGVEKKINVSQLGDLFLTRDTTQVLSSSDQRQIREKISATEIIISNIVGTGNLATKYIPHNLNTFDVIVQVVDDEGNQVTADVDAYVGTGSNLGNYVSVTGFFQSSVFYKVLIIGSRGVSTVVSSQDSAPS